MNDCDSVGWSNLYLLGEEKIDSEHKRLFELAKVIETYKNNPNSIKNAIKELVKYTKIHFANEERYMKSIQYINLEQHKIIHKQIVENLQEIITNFDSTQLDDVYNKVIDFVRNGLVQHIMIEDKKVQHKDHKELFMIAFKAFSHKETKDPRKHVKSVIIELNKYMKEHFQREEEFMDSIFYPLADEHKKLHEKIINQINELIKRIPTMSIEQFERELLASIDIWLVNHIIHEDQKIICFQNSESDIGINLDDID